MFDQVAGTEYRWNWIDGTDSSFVATATEPGKVIKHTFTNPAPSGEATFPVLLAALLPQGCIDTNTENVVVYGQAFGSVTPSRTEICSDETVVFANQSQGIADHRWFYREQG